ncbi:substrate-binding domain-containing protein [Phormidium sp. FACHB-592]|uniref:Substrate-binding domain-containing protein n=1 Tax=Stenomitos frigidus AS-A4 TaxID=2933935 RepID=A0ABV0KNW5_9CYAN|nr:substrate-binding domain-containing protein [Phormidium sp. FACHB-592]MBD2072884.1 substrate-binding domain-containing protein [Phormidium sp. FACHB-592]
MKKVAVVLLRTFLRRYPLATRLNLFNSLEQYVWLKDMLEELRPELFPPQQDVIEATVDETGLQKPDSSVLGILEQSEIRGRIGYYKAKTYLGARGNGHLFSAIELTSKRPVIIKEFLLPTANFTKINAHQRQNGFQRLACFQLADGRRQDFRVIQPFEAIADTASCERCFLVSDFRDGTPTLRQHLQQHGALSLPIVQNVLSQILQTLDFLHNQKFSFPAGAVQNGLVHGNLSLDSILWTEQHDQPFVYLCDLRLWEQWFDPAVKDLQPTQVTPETRQQDLRAVGEIGMTLLQGLEAQPITIEPKLRQILDSLRTAKFDQAETARRALLKLTERSPSALAPLNERTAQIQPSSRFSALLLLSLGALAIGALMLLPRLRSTEARPSSIPTVSTCCLAEVSAMPEGNYTYTAVQRGTWATVLQQRNLLQRGSDLTTALALAQPKLRLQYIPTQSLDQVLSQVQSGAADFAVLPLIGNLPRDLLAQEIAYDGLATVVSFSYAKRQQGLPATLNGRLSLDQVQQLYTGQIDQWQRVGGPALSVQRYTSHNPEAIALFEQRVLKVQTLQTIPAITKLAPLDLLRRVIRDFEGEGIGSIGMAPLSELWGQCSVYPLALSQKGQGAVQPLVLSDGQAIEPTTDLCSRKGAYGPALDRFQTGQYPLSYPLMVVYPRNNRRSAIGKKFVELMRTIEGQRLLRAAGLIPLTQATQQPVTSSTQR